MLMGMGLLTIHNFWHCALKRNYTVTKSILNKHFKYSILIRVDIFKRNNYYKLLAKHWAELT